MLACPGVRPPAPRPDPAAHYAARRRGCRSLWTARMGQHARVAPLIEPPNSVLLVVGREEFTPPGSFGGRVCAATYDCVAIGVVSVDDAPTLVAFSPAVTRADLQQLGRFTLETEGM